MGENITEMFILCKNPSSTALAPVLNALFSLLDGSKAAPTCYIISAASHNSQGRPFHNPLQLRVRKIEAKNKR
jgi:hypothetical protein